MVCFDTFCLHGLTKIVCTVLNMWLLLLCRVYSCISPRSICYIHRPVHIFLSIGSIYRFCFFLLCIDSLFGFTLIWASIKRISFLSSDVLCVNISIIVSLCFWILIPCYFLSFSCIVLYAFNSISIIIIIVIYFWKQIILNWK